MQRITPSAYSTTFGKWYSQLEIYKVNLQLQEDQLEDTKVYEEEEPDKCKYLNDNISGLKNLVNTLNVWSSHHKTSTRCQHYKAVTNMEHVFVLPILDIDWAQYYPLYSFSGPWTYQMLDTRAILAGDVKIKFIVIQG